MYLYAVFARQYARYACDRLGRGKSARSAGTVVESQVERFDEERGRKKGNSWSGVHHCKSPEHKQ
jgi:hypothetical protein